MILNMLIYVTRIGNDPSFYIQAGLSVVTYVFVFRKQSMYG